MAKDKDKEQIKMLQKSLHEHRLKIAKQINKKILKLTRELDAIGYRIETFRSDEGWKSEIINNNTGENYEQYQ